MVGSRGGAPCLTDDTLGALVQGTLEASAARRVAVHLDGCAACRQLAIVAAQNYTRPDDARTEGFAARPGVLVHAPAGTRVGRYELRALIGFGGMGAVYDAHDTELDRAVAVKVLRPELSEAPGLTERLVYESRLMAKIAHPSVITVYDVGHEGDATFIAMELIRGSTLTAWLAAQPRDWCAIVSVFERAGHGLAAAHGAGIVHRDFKPDNVLVSYAADRVVVTDFGIAREAVEGLPAGRPAEPRMATLADLPMTMNGAVIGTPAYMAPEQAVGRRADHRADVFAFSVSLWQALFGARPFRGASVLEIYTAMRQRPVPPPGARRVPSRLVRALRKGLALNPGDRWPDMARLVDELAAIRAVRKRTWLAVGATGLTGIAVVAALRFARSSEPVDLCETAEASLDGAYNPALVASLGAVLAAEPAIQREVLATLARAATAWRETHHATCRADRPVLQDPETAACLDARRVEIAGTVDDLIANGAAGAPYATWFSELVGRPWLCAAPLPGLTFASVPADRALRRKVVVLRERLADARASRDRQEFAAAIDRAGQVAAAATAVWPPVYAEAQLVRGAAQRCAGDVKLAIGTLLDAAAAAERVRDDDIAARSWAQLAEAAAFDQGDTAHGLEYVRYAEAAADRIGRPASIVAQLEYVNGMLLGQAHRWEEAEVTLRKALAVTETSGMTAEVGAADQGLGRLYVAQERYADAVAMFRRAIDSASRLHQTGSAGGALYFEDLARVLAVIGKPQDAEAAVRRAVELGDHALAETSYERPFLHLSLAEILLDVGRPGDALAEATAAVAVVARTQGQRSQRYGEAVMRRADVLARLGRYGDAAPRLERACEILAFARGDDDADTVAACQVSRAAALSGLHRDAQALAALDQAVPVLTRAYGESHLKVVEAVLARGGAQAGLGHRDAALADFARVIAVLANKQVESGYLAAARWRHGAALWPEQPAAARAEVAQALSLFATANGRWSRERDDARRWLSRHGGSRRP